MSLPLNLEIENIILRDLVFKSERNDTWTTIDSMKNML